jgi:DNA-binding NarL/FixJ family response regulator
VNQAQAADVRERLRVLLVDSHDLIHHGFRAVLSREPWVEELSGARTSAEALVLARRHRPHVAVIDTELLAESTADLCQELAARSPSTRILLTSGQRVSESHAKRFGAAGVVPKTWDGRDIADATRLVALGHDFFTPSSEQPAALLSPREQAVLEILVAGATNREIADRLHLSQHTVKDHVSTLYRKLKARNRADAVVRAQRLGLLD